MHNLKAELLKKPSKEPKPTGNQYLKYSQLGLQLFITIGLCGFLGYKMDEWWNNGNSLFVILIALIGTAGAIYQLYRSLPKE